MAREKPKCGAGKAPRCAPKSRPTGDPKPAAESPKPAAKPKAKSPRPRA